MDFLFELLLALAELFLEVLFELAGEVLIDLFLRAIVRAFEPSRLENPALASIMYLLLGGLTGGVSLLIFPHRLVRLSRIHGLSLLLAPLITGSVMALVGSALLRRGKQVVRLESFGYGFAFALGMALIRFFFIS